MKLIALAARSVVFNVLSAALFGLIAYLLLFGRSELGTGPAVIALLAAVFCALIGNLQHFVSLRVTVSGVEAKLREVQEVLDDAKATVASLHQLAVTTGAFLVESIAADQRFAGEGTEKRKDEVKARLIDRLKAIGLSDDALLEVSQGDRHWVCVDYAIGVLHTPYRATGDDSLELGELVNRPDPASPEECETFIKRLGWNDTFTAELLADYKHYVETGEHRHPEVWHERASWGRADRTK